MYRNIFAIKNILLIIILALSLVSLLQSCSYAWTWQDFKTYSDQLRNDSSVPGDIRTGCNQLLNNISLIESRLSSNGINLEDYNYFLIEYTSSYPGTLGLNLYSTINSYSYTTNTCTLSNVNGRQVGIYNLRSGGYTISYNNSKTGNAVFNASGVKNKLWGLIIDASNYGGFYLNDKYIPPYTGPVFSPSNNGNINVVAPNGQSESMLRLPFSYSGQNDWTLGYLSDYKDVYQIHGYFGPMVFASGELYTEGYLNTFIYDKYYGVNNNNLIFDKSSGRISINKNSLLNKQAYNLYLSYTLDSTSTSEDIGDFNYYAYYYNLSISSGDLMSPDLNSTVDVSIVRALTDYFNFYSGDADSLNYVLDSNIFNFSLSGDLFSGDIALKMGYKDYFDNDYSSFIYSIYRNVLTLLSDEGTNSHITLNLRGNTYNIYARDFSVPDGALKSFIRLFLITGYVYLIYLQIHSIIFAITILDFNSLLHSFDRDHSFFM